MNDSAARARPTEHLEPPGPALRATYHRGLRRAVRDAVRRPNRRAVLLDALLWAALVLPPLAGNMIPTRPDDPRWWLQVAGVAGLTAAVVLCRAVPLASLVIVIVLLTVHGNFAVGLPVMSYLTGRRTARSRPVLWTFTGVFVAGSVWNLVRGIDVTLWFPMTIWLVLLGVLPWLAGLYWRQYQELVYAGWQRAEQLEREQRIVAEQERLRERSRIAQDMHDSLGHELALIAVRAGALQVAPGLDERHRTAAAELRAGAADATEQLRKIIGVLRVDTGGSPDGPAAPARSPGPVVADAEAAPIRPARESIADLVDRAHASGIAVRLTGNGAPLDLAPMDLAPMVGLAAHRVVQEAITNAAKHAPGAAVEVGLARTGHGTMTVTVANGAPPAGGGQGAAPGGGRGLAGLTERVRLVNGTLRTGATPGGGFQVRAELPCAGGDIAPGAGQLDGSGASGLRGGTASESALRLARERRQVRRSLITVIAVPAALIAALSAVMVGYYIVVTLNSALSPGRYAVLQVGAPQSQVERSTPRMELIDADNVRDQQPEPRGADCRYYRSDSNLLGTGRVYRLCFAQGRLASKDVLHPSRVPAGQQTPGTVETSRP